MDPTESCTPFLQRAFASLTSDETEVELEEEDWEESMRHVGRCAVILAAFLDPAQHDVPSLVQRFRSTALANTTPEVLELNAVLAGLLEQKLNVVVEA